MTLEHATRVDGSLELESEPVGYWDAVNLGYVQNALQGHEGTPDPETNPAIYYRMGFRTAFVWWEGFADQVSGHGHYLVYISTDAAFNTLVGDPVKTKASWTVFTGLDTQQTYYFKVCAISAGGDNLGCVTDTDTTEQVTNDDIEWVTIEKLRAGQLQVSEWIASSDWNGGTDYAAGTSGWFIDGAGNASFQNAIFRGDIDVSNLIGEMTIETSGAMCTELDNDGRQLCIGDINLAGGSGPHRIGWTNNIGEALPTQMFSGPRDLNGILAPTLGLSSGSMPTRDSAAIALWGEGSDGSYESFIGLFAQQVGFQHDTQVMLPRQGTADAPALTYDNDLDVGWYWAAANHQRWTSNGFDLLRGLWPDGISPGSHGLMQCGFPSFAWANVNSFAFSNVSDLALKEAVVDSDLGLSFIELLRPVKFNWTEDRGDNNYGFIAQEVATVLGGSDTGIVHSPQNFLIDQDYDENGDPLPLPQAYMGLDYTQLIAPLVKAVQELSARLAAVELEVL